MYKNTKKYNKLIVLLYLYTIMISLISCSESKNYSVELIDGIKHYYNKNEPSAKNSIIKYEKIRTLDLEEIYGKPIYTINFNSPHLYLNDKNQIVLRFCYSHQKDNYLTELNCVDSSYQQHRIKYGIGPEEIKYLDFMCQSDSLIMCGNRNKILSLDRDLNYISELSNGETYDEVKDIRDVYGIFSKKLLCYKFIIKHVKGNNQDAEFCFNVGLHDEYTFQENKSLISCSVTDEFEEINYYSLFRKVFDAAYSKNEIFIAELDPEKYRIHVYDHKGDKKYVINKSFRKIKYHENEIEMISDKFFKVSKRKLKQQYKQIIKDISSDENGYLFVHTSEEYKDMKENELTYEIFKDGVFIDRLVLESNNNAERFLFSKNLFFAGDKMINIGYNKDGNILLEIYNYKIEVGENR